jgi:hypothetical protein
MSAGLQREAEYFAAHPVYAAVADASKERLGSANLGQSLSRILVAHVSTRGHRRAPLRTL